MTTRKPKAAPAPTEPAGLSVRDRILNAAFDSFIEHGYAGTSTLMIASRAKVSKRDLYANFGDKQAMLLACITRRASRMGIAAELPTPRDRAMLAAVLMKFGSNLMREVSHPTVLATFRLAVAEAERSPEVARSLHDFARMTTHKALTDFLARAQSAGLLGDGAPMNQATQFIAMLWNGLLVNLLLGVAAQPKPEEIERHATRATQAFLKLHGT